MQRQAQLGRARVHQRDEARARSRRRAGPARSPRRCPTAAAARRASSRARPTCPWAARRRPSPGRRSACLVIGTFARRRHVLDDEQRGHHLRHAGDRQRARRVACATAPGRCRGRTAARRAAGGRSDLDAVGAPVGGSVSVSGRCAGARRRPARWRSAAAPRRRACPRAAAGAASLAGARCRSAAASGAASASGDDGEARGSLAGGCSSAPKMPKPNIARTRSESDRQHVGPAADQRRGSSAGEQATSTNATASAEDQPSRISATAAVGASCCRCAKACTAAARTTKPPMCAK